MRQSKKLGSIAVALVLSLTGCADQLGGDASSAATNGATAYANGDLSTLTYRAVDLMLSGAPEVAPNTPMFVASVADTQRMDRGSAFGNIISDMIRTRLVQDGHTSSEIRLREGVSFSGGEGEFMLSRDRRALMRPPYAAAVVTGTYAASYEKIYVSLKLVSAIDAHIISGADFVVPLRGLTGMMPQFNPKS